MKCQNNKNSNFKLFIPNQIVIVFIVKKNIKKLNILFL